MVSVAAGVPDRQDRTALPAGTAGRAGHAEHAGPRGRGDERPLGGRARRARPHLDDAEALLAAVGRVVRVPESQQDAVTALSGSGPAYFFYLVEAMIDAGILLGLPRALAADLIVQTALGAGVMLRDSGEHPVQLREAVTCPGGTTIAAIRELERHGVRAALLAAIEAAHDALRGTGRGRIARLSPRAHPTVCHQVDTGAPDTPSTLATRVDVAAHLPRTDRSPCSIHPSLLPH